MRRCLSILLATLLGTACAPAASPVLPVMCREVAAADPHPDTVWVTVHVDSIARGSAGEVLVRVDPLASAHVAFETPPPPTAVALSTTFSLARVYQGCLAFAPGALFVRTPAAPRGKAWLRISADRTVRVRVETGEPGPGATPVSDWLTVVPGTSARGPWRRGVGR